MSTEAVAASNMTTMAAEATHEIGIWIELSVRLIEAISVIIIVLAILYSTYIFIRRIRGRKGPMDPIEEYKTQSSKIAEGEHARTSFIFSALGAIMVPKDFGICKY